MAKHAPEKRSRVRECIIGARLRGLLRRRVKPQKESVNVNGPSTVLFGVHSPRQDFAESCFSPIQHFLSHVTVRFTVFR